MLYRRSRRILFVLVSVNKSLSRRVCVRITGTRSPNDCNRMSTFFSLVLGEGEAGEWEEFMGKGSRRGGCGTAVK